MTTYEDLECEYARSVTDNEVMLQLWRDLITEALRSMEGVPSAKELLGSIMSAIIARNAEFLRISDNTKVAQMPRLTFDKASLTDNAVAVNAGWACNQVLNEMEAEINAIIPREADEECAAANMFPLHYYVWLQATQQDDAEGAHTIIMDYLYNEQ